MPTSESDDRWSGRPWTGGPWGGGPPWNFRTDGDGERRRPHRGWLPVILAVVLQIPGVAIAVHFGADALTLAALGLAIAASFLLVPLRTHPGPCVALIGLLCAPGIELGIGPPLSAIPLAIAVVGGVVRGARTWVWGTVAGIAVLAPLLAFATSGSSLAIIRPLMTALVLSLLVGIGELLRNRRERYREVARQVAARRQSAAEAERVRIARELHDVLAHSLSQISVQAGVGLHLFETQPERAKASLASIKETSGQALEEVRGVLGFLRSADDDAPRAPEPDLSRLPALVASYEESGLEIRLHNDVPPEAPAATQLALYRIVQESLTNVSRHADASRVDVTLAVDRASYVLTVTDDGKSVATTAIEGRGLMGMRERAELLGGSLTAGPQTEAAEAEDPETQGQEAERQATQSQETEGREAQGREGAQTEPSTGPGAHGFRVEARIPLSRHVTQAGRRP